MALFFNVRRGLLTAISELQHVFWKSQSDGPTGFSSAKSHLTHNSPTPTEMFFLNLKDIIYNPVAAVILWDPLYLWFRVMVVMHHLWYHDISWRFFIIIIIIIYKMTKKMLQNCMFWDACHRTMRGGDKTNCLEIIFLHVFTEPERWAEAEAWVVKTPVLSTT